MDAVALCLDKRPLEKFLWPEGRLIKAEPLNGAAFSNYILDFIDRDLNFLLNLESLIKTISCYKDSLEV